VRTNQFRAYCPGIGWEREQQQRAVTIGGRSAQWHVTPADVPVPSAEADEDAVIVRGTD
jgi:hypothetical protein